MVEQLASVVKEILNRNCQRESSDFPEVQSNNAKQFLADNKDVAAALETEIRRALGLLPQEQEEDRPTAES